MFYSSPTIDVLNTLAWSWAPSQPPSSSSRYYFIAAHFSLVFHHPESTLQCAVMNVQNGRWYANDCTSTGLAFACLNTNTFTVRGVLIISFFFF